MPVCVVARGSGDGSVVVAPWGLGWRNPRLKPWDGGALRIDPTGVALNPGCLSAASIRLIS